MIVALGPRQVLGVLQPLNALFRGNPGDGTQRRRVWERVHKTVGRGLLVAAVVTIAGGFVLPVFYEYPHRVYCWVLKQFGGSYRNLRKCDVMRCLDCDRLTVDFLETPPWLVVLLVAWAAAFTALALVAPQLELPPKEERMP
jgi:hypothetical protein